MKSKSFNTEQNVMDQIKENKSFKFVKLYKSAAESKVEQFETTKLSKKSKKGNKSSQPELDKSKHSRSFNKNKKKLSETLDLSNIEGDENSFCETKSFTESSLTSTPNNKGEHSDNSVKSIMKIKSHSLLNVSNISTPSSKPKKRNKSVSFMLEDVEELVVKKSKSNSSNEEHKNGVKEKDINSKVKAEDANKTNQKKNLKLKGNLNVDSINYINGKDDKLTLDIPLTKEPTSELKKKLKKGKKSKLQNEEPDKHSEDKSNKLKKEKRKAKSILDGNMEAEGEPAMKTRKKDLKPEIIAKGLENLNIGDNAHTLTNLLDEMTVVDKSKKKRDRKKQKKNKVKKSVLSETKQKVPEDTNKEENEKIKWGKRKWNKYTKGDSTPRLHTSVVVENLPIKIMCNYKSLLSEHFSKFGTIAGIGVAEAYPTEDPKPVFTTTVYFQEEEAAKKALEEDNMVFQGSRIRLRRPLPATQTTLVVRSHGLTEQAISSMFTSAGRIRTIRQCIKGKKSTPVAFVEFDGPETVERALKIAGDEKMQGKKMYVSRFEIRNKGKPTKPEQNSMNDSNNDSSTE